MFEEILCYSEIFFDHFRMSTALMTCWDICRKNQIDSSQIVQKRQTLSHMLVKQARRQFSQL